MYLTAFCLSQYGRYYVILLDNLRNLLVRERTAVLSALYIVKLDHAHLLAL